MLTLWGKILMDGKVLKADTYTSDKEDMSAALLDGLEHFSKEFDIEVPMWHTAHTKQLGLFRKVMFKQDDFIDKFPYDKFEMQIIDQ